MNLNIQNFFYEVLPSCDRCTIQEVFVGKMLWTVNLLLEIFCSSFWSFCQVLVEADGEV